MLVREEASLVVGSLEPDEPGVAAVPVPILGLELARSILEREVWEDLLVELEPLLDHCIEVHAPEGGEEGMKEIREYESYPLSWPVGVKRNGGRNESRFDQGTTLYQARQKLRREISLLPARDLVISTNIKTRADGEVYSNSREPDDPGVAIYFKFRGVSRCLASDFYRTVRENTWALAKTIEAMRGIDRWGVSEMLERMFTGFRALPAPEQIDWWNVLGVPRDSPVEKIRSAYRRAIMEAHPDRGSSGDAARIEEAWRQAKIERAIA